MRVYAENPGVKREQQRAANMGIENVPARTARNAMRNRRAGGGAGNAGGRR